MPAVSGKMPPGLVKKMVKEALEELHVIISSPPSSEENQVDNMYVIKVEGNPRLKVEYEE